MRRPAALTAAVTVLGAMSLATGCSVFSADEEALAPPPAASLTTDPGIGLTVVDEADRGAPLCRAPIQNLFVSPFIRVL